MVQKETLAHSTPTTGTRFENARYSHLAKRREFPKHWSQITTILPEYRICPFLRSTSERLEVLFRVLHDAKPYLLSQGHDLVRSIFLATFEGTDPESTEINTNPSIGSAVFTSSFKGQSCTSLLKQLNQLHRLCLHGPRLLVPYPHLVSICICLSFKHHTFFTGVDGGAKTKRCHGLHGT